jgi:hypothetical protein
MNCAHLVRRTLYGTGYNRNEERNLTKLSINEARKTQVGQIQLNTTELQLGSEREENDVLHPGNMFSKLSKEVALAGAHCVNRIQTPLK